MTDLNMKWNDYPSDSLYLWDGETLFVIKEGDGSNLFYEDEERGYEDYWLTNHYSFHTYDGCQWMEKKTIYNIDYTLQGVLDRIGECDLWESDWKILDKEIGEELQDYFEKYWLSHCLICRHKRDIEEIIKKI